MRILASIIMCLIILPGASLSLHAEDQMPPLRLERPSESLLVVEGTTYGCKLLTVSLNPGVDFKAGNISVPGIRGFDPIVWNDKGGRIYSTDHDSRITVPVVEEKSDGIHISLKKQANDFFECEASYLLKNESMDLSYVFKAKKDVTHVGQVTVEISPEWDLFAGSSISYVRKDGSPGRLELPAAGTKDGKYVDTFSGNVQSMKISGFNSMPGAGFELRGPVSVFFQQVGTKLRWHIGLNGKDLDTPIKAGDSLTINFSLYFQKSATDDRSEVKVNAMVDASKTNLFISPYVFGAQLTDVGFGKQLSGLRHPYQNDFNYDKESRAFALDSGVTFFRIYLASLYGIRSEPDPICPREDATCDYSKVDSFMKGLHETGIELVPNVGLWCPSWLSTQRKSASYSGLWIIHRAPPKDNAKWAKIIAGLVAYLNIEKKYGVKQWEIGNEPDGLNGWVRYWVGGTVPEFIDYFKAASRAMKAADPTILISGPDLGDLYGKGWPENKLVWRDEFAKACKDDFDGFSFNRYGASDFTKYVEDARETLKVARASDKAICVPEYNVSESVTDVNHTDFSGGVFVAKALKSLIENGVFRASFNTWDGPNSFGFFSYGKDTPMTPQPTYYAFKMHAKLGNLKNGTVLANTCDDKGISILTCRHSDQKGYTVVLSSDNYFVRNYAVHLKFENASGNYTMKYYQLVPGSTILELPGEHHSLSDAINLTLPGRGITTLVLREN